MALSLSRSLMATQPEAMKDLAFFLFSAQVGKTSKSLAVASCGGTVSSRRPCLGPQACIEATRSQRLSSKSFTSNCSYLEITLEKIISELNTSTEPRLILLDNFETPCNALALGGTQKQVGISLVECPQINYKMTTRGRSQLFIFLQVRFVLRLGIGLFTGRFIKLFSCGDLLVFTVSVICIARQANLEMNC